VSGFEAGEPVRSFLEVFRRAPDELLDEQALAIPGLDGDEAMFLAAADRDYDADRHDAFEIRPAETALLVIDLQEDFVRPTSPMCQPEALRQLPRVRSLIDVCRRLAVPAVFTAATYLTERLNDTPAYCAPVASGRLRAGTAGTEIAAELGVCADEHVIRTKHTYDAFHGTELDSLLRSLGIRTVIVCGTMTNYCCEATARGAFDRGYHVVFGSDVTATDSALSHVATLRTMRRGYARVMDAGSIMEALRGRDRMYERASRVRLAAGEG
jgi:nicotinamidase-related amidase